MSDKPKANVLMLNVPIDKLTHAILTEIQKQEKLESLSAVVERISHDWWRGKSSPQGHVSMWPTVDR